MPLTKSPSGKSVVPIVINDKPLPISKDESDIQPVVNAATGETVHYYASTSVDVCNQACEAAYAAFQGQKKPGSGWSITGNGWKNATVSTRRNLIMKVADLFEERKKELVECQKLETACDDHWGAMNVSIAVSYMREIAACVSHIKGMFYFFYVVCYTSILGYRPEEV